MNNHREVAWQAAAVFNLVFSSLLVSTSAQAGGISALPNLSTASSPQSTMQAVSKAYLADDNATVLQLLKQGSDQGDPVADVGLALIYYNGMHGVQKDYLKAALYFTRAAQEGYDITKVRVQGNQSGIGNSPQTNYITLDKWLARQLAEGDRHSDTEVGGLKGAWDDASNVTLKAAASLYLNLTDQEDRVVEFIRGVTYANGRGVPVDMGQAAVWYLRSAKQEYAPAQFNLALLYANGQGVVRDTAQAINWYTKAANQEYAPAQYNLALMLASDVASSPSLLHAVALLNSAADHGYAPAAYMLGLIYANGRGVPQDDTIAARWYSKAAAAGFPAAEYNLALLYSEGRGVPRNDQLATQWYVKAAQVGFPAADYNLAVQCATGHGTQRDPVEAYSWALLAKAAARPGTTVDRLADALEQELGPSLTPTQVTQGQNMAATFFLKNP